jgi:hypothetical protein
MKKIDTSPILGGAIDMPVKAGTWEHITNALGDIPAWMLGIIFIGSVPGGVMALYGCKNTGAGSNYIIGAGAVYYNGEVFDMPSATFTAAVGAVMVLETTYYTATDGGGYAKADPVLFTDGVSRNIFQIRKIKVVDGNSSTAGYIANYSALDLLSFDTSLHTVGAAGEPAFQNSWGNTGGGTTAMCFRKNVLGEVTIIPRRIRGDLYTSGGISTNARALV